MVRVPMTIHTVGLKAVCGLLAALLIIAAPLPVLADAQPDPQTARTTQLPTEPAAATSTPAQTAETTRPTATVLPANNSTVTPAATSPASTAGSVSDSPQNPSQPASPVNGPATTVQVSNGVDSGAVSGETTVKENQTAGNALSGTATATATVLTVANTNGSNAGSFKTFNCDITRDIQDTIVIDPSTLMPLPECTNGGVVNGVPLQSPATTGGLQSGSSLVTILNDIILSAHTGNALVNGNGTAGDATSGDALALANVINIANSSITSRNSFLGVINIYSQLKGDILVPQSFVDGLVRGSGGGSLSGDTNINTTINASAASGNASVSGNQTGGNAVSGNSMTSLTVLNLTGQEVIARNSLLVFVNVLGKWMGMVVPAAAGNGNTTALLGGGLQGSSVSVTPAPTSKVVVAPGRADTAITNNITVQATTGDATVSANETGGNAATGNAAAGVNLLNITDSNFWLQDWFGALFINVLGSWLGDFDIQADAPATPPAGSAPPEQVQGVKVFRFTAATALTQPARPAVTSGIQQTTTVTDDSPIIAASTVEAVTTGKVLGANSFEDQAGLGKVNGNGPIDPWVMTAAIIAMGMMAIAGVTIIRRHFKN